MPTASGLYYHLYQGGDMEMLPVVLIHGAGGNHLVWPPEIRRLPEYRTFAIDLPGHGKSDGRGLQSIESYAESVFIWFKSLNMNRAVFIGHSMGAAICLMMAIQHSEYVLGVVLVGAGARLPVPAEALANSTNPTTSHKAVEAMTQHAFSQSADPRLVEMAARRMEEGRPSVLHGDLLACEAFDVTETVHKVSQPALVLCGSEDQLTPPRFAQFLASSIPQARLEIIPQTGHMVMLEAPQDVTKALVEFLRSIPYLAG